MSLSKPAIGQPSAFFCILILLASSPLPSQELTEMEYEELSAQIIVDDPETSVLRVESTIPGLQFNSRGGIKRVREAEDGVWEVLLHPGVHYRSSTI